MTQHIRRKTNTKEDESTQIKIVYHTIILKNNRIQHNTTQHNKEQYNTIRNNNKIKYFYIETQHSTSQRNVT